MAAPTVKSSAWPLAPLVLAVALSFLASACSPGASGAGDSAPSEAPQPGGLLRLFNEAPQSLDPADAASIYESLPVNQIFDGLVSIDPGLNILPSLATSWTLSRDQ